MTNPLRLDTVDDILDALVVRSDRLAAKDERLVQYVSYAYDRADGLLGTRKDYSARRSLELRLRLAMHLSPATAIEYDSESTTPRWKLIYQHLITQHNRTSQSSESLAREIAAVLDAWDKKREQVTSRRAFLIRRDGPLCAHCKAGFGTSPGPPSLHRKIH